MTTSNISETSDDVQINLYRNTINNIHNKFNELEQLLQNDGLEETHFFLSVAYKSFTDKIFDDIKNNESI